MARTVLALVAQVVLAIVVALLLAGLWQGVIRADLAAGFAEGARLLFFFMDIGLAVWVVILIVLTVRGRALPGIAVTLLAAVAGVVLNFLTVLIVGLVHGGGEVSTFLGYALEAGIAFLLAVLITAPIIRRIARPA